MVFYAKMVVNCVSTVILFLQCLAADNLVRLNITKTLHSTWGVERYEMSCPWFLAVSFGNGGSDNLEKLLRTSRNMCEKYYGQDIMLCIVLLQGFILLFLSCPYCNFLILVGSVGMRFDSFRTDIRSLYYGGNYLRRISRPFSSFKKGPYGNDIPVQTLLTISS